MSQIPRFIPLIRHNEWLINGCNRTLFESGEISFLTPQGPMSTFPVPQLTSQMTQLLAISASSSILKVSIFASSRTPSFLPFLSLPPMPIPAPIPAPTTDTADASTSGTINSRSLSPAAKSLFRPVTPRRRAVASDEPLISGCCDDSSVRWPSFAVRTVEPEALRSSVWR